MTRERSWHARQRLIAVVLLLLLLLTMLTWSLCWCPPRHYDVAWLHCWPQHRGWLLVVVKIPPRQNEAKHHDLGCCYLGPELVLTFWRSPVRQGEMVRDDSEEGGEGAGDGAGDTPDIHPSLQPTALDILSTDTANTPKNCGQTHSVCYCWSWGVTLWPFWHGTTMMWRGQMGAG